MGNYGKLTRLPYRVSEDLHARILDQQPREEILTWLNGNPEVRKVLSQHFNGADVTPQNLSDYINGPKYKEWFDKLGQLERHKRNTKYAVSLAQEAGMDLSDAGDAILTSRLIEALEELEEDIIPGGSEEEMKEQRAAKHEKLMAITEMFSRLRTASISRGSLAIREKELSGRQKKLELAEKTMEMNTVKAFMKWAQSKEAAAILTSGKPKTVQMDLLHELMFGTNPDLEGPPV